MTDRRCRGDCPNLGFCDNVPWLCGWHYKKNRDWKAIRDRHERERQRKMIDYAINKNET